MVPIAQAASDTPAANPSTFTLISLGTNSVASASQTPHAIMMNKPIIGRYVYRSAIDCTPTCISPITGTSIPKYQSQPVKRYCLLLPSHKTSALISKSTMIEMITSTTGHLPGCGYKTANPRGQNMFRTYKAYATAAFANRSETETAFETAPPLA